MDIWQIKAVEKMTAFITDLYNVKEIELCGSMLNKSLLDIFSDVDMNIFLQGDSDFDKNEFICKLTGKFKVFGYEIHVLDNMHVFRICLENGWRFDLSFYHSKPIHTEDRIPADTFFKDKIDSIINSFWFHSFMILVKLGRGDYLVASHLTLELCQIDIVIQMLVRDNQSGTNIHRFGEKEDIPILDSLFRLDNTGNFSHENTATKIKHVLFLAAEHMDNTSESLNLGYSPQSNKLKALQHKFNV